MVRSSAAAAYLYFSQLHINNNRYNIASAEVLSANTKPEKPQKFLTIYLHGYRQFFLSVLCALSGLCVFLIVPQRRRDRKRFSKGFLFDSNYTSSSTNYQLFYTQFTTCSYVALTAWTQVKHIN